MFGVMVDRNDESVKRVRGGKGGSTVIAEISRALLWECERAGLSRKRARNSRRASEPITGSRSEHGVLQISQGHYVVHYNPLAVESLEYFVYPTTCLA